MADTLSPFHVIFYNIFNAGDDFNGAKRMSASQTLKQNLYLHAVKLLSLRPHSSLELSQKLARVAARKMAPPWKRYNRPDVPVVAFDSSGLPPKEVANEVIHDLEHMKVLDDTAFAQWFCKQRQGACASAT
jgi:SOS response regulatory protein OraA/RecX